MQQPRSLSRRTERAPPAPFAASVAIGDPRILYLYASSNNKQSKSDQKGKEIDAPQVAAYLGFHGIDRISRWESGKKYPHVLNFLKLLELYGVMPHELCECWKATSSDQADPHSVSQP